MKNENKDVGVTIPLFNRSQSEDVHFFIHTMDTWVTGTDLNECLLRLKTNTRLKDCYVYKVLQSEGIDYKINWYVPQVDAENLIFVGEFKLTKLRK